MDIIFKIIGSIGLLLISAGVVIKGRQRQNILYISGGISLLIYSIELRDMIFIILQVVFILAAIYDESKTMKNA